MGSIVEFRPRTTLVAPVCDEAKSGEIILFTGVRYERTAPAEPQAKWSSKGWMSPFQPNPAKR